MWVEYGNIKFSFVTLRLKNYIKLVIFQDGVYGYKGKTLVEIENET